MNASRRGRPRTISLVLIWLAVAGGCGGSSTPTVGADGWERGTPESVGFDVQRLDALTAAIRNQTYPNVHALLIEKDGRLVYEEYFEGEDVRRGSGPLGHVVFDTHTLHDVRSVTKSVTSALVGIAIGSGLIESLDQPLVTFFPQHADLAGPEKHAITVRHALTMSTGLEWSEALPYDDLNNDERRLNRSADPAGFVLSRPVAAKPGTVFNYSAGDTQLLAGAVERATGRPLDAYAKDVLFAPLGITEFEWVRDTAGEPSAASGLRLRPLDLARFGSLYLTGGRWRGTQIIPSSWIEATLTRQMELPTADSDGGRHGYTLLWWHSRFDTSRGEVVVVNASGNGGQNVFVVPALRLAVTVLGGRYNEGDFLTEAILLDHILPALR
jgi:CubicO group peptidase (beta-lactamase class C family)